MKLFAFTFVLFFDLLNLRLQVYSQLSNIKLFSNLPAGPFALSIKNATACENKPIKMDVRLYEDSHTRFEINSTYLIPFDDTLFVRINLAFNDTNGKWKESFLTHTIPNGCSSMKVLMGNQYSKFINGMGIFDLNCPKKKGVYKATNILDTSMILKMNIPKTFIYGTYKFDLIFSRKSQILGCNQFVTDVFRA